MRMLGLGGAVAVASLTGCKTKKTEELGEEYANPDDETSVPIPAVNEQKCIGCGACENLCPARPFSAIYVEGHEVHKQL